MKNHGWTLLALAMAISPLQTGCSSASSGAAPETTPTDTPTAGSDETAETDGADTADTAELPAPYAPSQGETAYGVYFVAVEGGNAPDAERVIAELRSRGVEGASAGELSCDQGAAEALSLPPETIVVSVDFRTREEATRFVAGWGGPVLGVAELVAYCRD